MGSNANGSGSSGKRPRGYVRNYWPHPKTRTLLDQVQEILREYDAHLPLTLRQIFYRLVAAYDYPKTEQAYQTLGIHLINARRAGEIPFDALRDDSAASEGDKGGFDGPLAWWTRLRDYAAGYRRDRQEGQPVRVEMWCETVGMMPQIARVAEKFGVPTFGCGGFPSLTVVRGAVERAASRDVDTVLLHVGDHDPSGVSIFDYLTEDVAAFLVDDAPERKLIAERIAITAEQAKGLPSAPPKRSDSRSASWKGETWHAEALPPDRLAEIVNDAIQRHLNDTIWRRAMKREKKERERVEARLARVIEEES